MCSVEKEDSSPKSETGDITADYVYLVKPFTLKRRDEAKKDIVSGSESGLDCNAIDHVKGNHFSTYHQPNFSNFVDRSCL